VPPLWKVKPSVDNPAAGIWVGPGANSSTDGLWLGSLGELTTGKQPRVYLSTSKEQVVAVVGKRGSGKSFTLGVIAEGLSLSSDSSAISVQHRRRATLLFDPLDVYWTTKFGVAQSNNAEANRHYEMAKALKLTGAEFAVEAWIPGGSNSRATDPTWFRSLQLPVSALGLDEWGLLLDINILTEPSGHALADAVGLVSTTGFTSHGRGTVARPAFGLEHLVDAIASDELAGLYHAETIRALRQRITTLHNTDLFSATGTPINSLLAPGRLSVVLLGRLPQAYRAGVVAVVTRMLVDERSRVAFAEKRLALDPNLTDSERDVLNKVVATGVPRTVVAMDEAQSFLAPGSGNIAREVFIKLVKEGRNIGLSAALATQQPSAIDSRILSQVETFIAHQLVTEPDIQAVRSNLKASLPDSTEFGTMNVKPAEVLRMLAPGQCLVSAADSNTAVRRSILVNVRPRATVHGGIEL
jgi:hypothetical protein